MRVSVALGELTPDDVMAEVVYGRPDDADELVAPSYATLTAEASEPGQRHRPQRALLRGGAA